MSQCVAPEPRLLPHRAPSRSPRSIAHRAVHRYPFHFYEYPPPYAPYNFIATSMRGLRDLHAAPVDQRLHSANV